MCNDWCGEVLDSCGARPHYRAENLCRADGVEPDPATLCTETLGSEFSLTHAVVFPLVFRGCLSEWCSQNGFDLFTQNGELSSLAVHKGISLRKSEKEKKRRGALVGSQLAEWVVVVFGQEAHALINAHNPYSHLCHSHSVALMLLIHLLHI